MLHSKFRGNLPTVQASSNTDARPYGSQTDAWRILCAPTRRALALEKERPGIGRASRR